MASRNARETSAAPDLRAAPNLSKRRISFTGTRRGLTAKQAHRLSEFMGARGWSELHHGDCVGADEAAHKGAHSLGWRIVIHPGPSGPLRAFCGPWDVLCAVKPNLARNHDIVAAGNELWACPAAEREELRSGTWATIRYARRLGRAIYIIRPDGEVGYEAPVAPEEASPPPISQPIRDDQP